MRSRRQTLLDVAGVLARVLLLLALLAVAAQDVSAYRRQQRGIASGLDADQPVLESPRAGINVALERYSTNLEVLEALSTVQALGYGTLVQHLPWDALEPEPGRFEWGFWDEVLPLVHGQGLEIVAVLERAPEWARPSSEADNPWAPPEDPAAYARFAAAIAERYGGQIRAYQIWDRPNIYPHWGKGAIDPAGYVALLKEAAAAIRAADPDALIIAGGMAPNTERSGRNMTDILFLREIYRLGGAPYFDVLGVKAYGFWSGAYDRRVDADVLNLSRVILLREEMLRRGEGAKPIWALEGGWAALPEGWDGQPSPLGSDSAFLQASRLKDAFARVQREWPWMTLFCALYLQPQAEEDDPVWGLSLLDTDGQPQPLMLSLEPGLQTGDTRFPGRHRVSSLLPPGLPATEERAVSIGFFGSDLLVEMDTDGLQGSLRVLAPHERTIILNARDDGIARFPVVRTAAAEKRTATLVGTVAQIDAIRGVQVGARPDVTRLWMTVVFSLLLGAWLLAGIVQGLRLIDWRRPYRWSRSQVDALPEGWILAAIALAFALAMVAPGSMVRLGFLALYGIAALLRPDAALLVAVATIPLAPLHVGLGPGTFSTTELAVLCAALARAGAAILGGERLELFRLKHVNPVDVLLLAFVIWAGIGAWHAEYQREALREFRTAVAEPALLYLLLRLTGGDRRLWRRLVGGFFASSVGVALYALVRYPSPAGVIEAEGVRRARGFFGSPNNLALYLERMLPLGLSVASEVGEGASGSRRRRWLWAGGALALLLAVVLTYSRGAWLLGVPAGLLVIGLLKGKRVRKYTLVALAILGLCLIPLMQTERFGSLLDLRSGTTFLRLQLWESSWEMAKDHLWTGVGLDNFLYYYGDYILPGAEIERWLSHPHNLFLDLLVRTGLPGLLLFLGALIAAVVPVARCWHVHAVASPAVLVGLLGGLAAMFAHGLIDNALFVPELAHWIFFVLAYLVNLPARLTEGGEWVD